VRLPEGLVTRPFAHRGLWRPEGPPENSLAAIDAACKAGYGIELDVRLTADDKAVVFHDETLERVCGLTGFTADHTSAELQEMRLMAGDERIPTLDQVLDLVDGRQMLLIEIKTPHAPEVLEALVASALDRYLGDAAVISFHAASLAWFADNSPDIPRGLDAAGPDDEMLERNGAPLEDLFDGQFDYARPHFLVLDRRMAGGKVATRYRAQGYPVICWTARSAAEVDAIADHVDNFIFEGFTA
jgi:glycerophosphoryl diester phosphodiesterase